MRCTPYPPLSHNRWLCQKKMDRISYPNANRPAMRNRRNRLDPDIVSRLAAALMRRDRICRNKEPHQQTGRRRVPRARATLTFYRRNASPEASTHHEHRSDMLAGTNQSLVPESRLRVGFATGSFAGIGCNQRWRSSHQKKEALHFARPLFVRSSLTAVRRGLVRQRLNVDATTFLIEVHVAVYQCENRVVLAHANIAAWVPLGSDLTDQDVAWSHQLATKLLHAASLGVGIATVTGRSLTFFVCHFSITLPTRASPCVSCVQLFFRYSPPNSAFRRPCHQDAEGFRNCFGEGVFRFSTELRQEVYR